MSTVLLTLTNQSLAIGSFESANIVSPGGAGLSFTLTRAGRPPGRPADGAIIDIKAWYSTDNAATWLGPAGATIPGGEVLDKWGDVLINDRFDFTWDTSVVPTHIKFQIDVYVDFTSTVTVTRL